MKKLLLGEYGIIRDKNMAFVRCFENPFCLDFNFYLSKSSGVTMFISYNLILLLETA